MIDLETIERLAKAATPGPWESETWCSDWQNNRWAAIGPVHNQNDNEDELNPDSSAGQAAEADSFFIAHMHPALALELVAEIRRLQDAFLSEHQAAVDMFSRCEDLKDELKRTRELLEESSAALELAYEKLKGLPWKGGAAGPSWITEPKRVLAKLRSVSPQGEKP